jgi:hypothetical protein
MLVGVTVEDEEPTVVFFRQHYVSFLAHASYRIGDTTTGRAVVVAPQHAPAS